MTAYDKNGNINALQRYGQTSTSAYGLIENLTFTLNGNQLNRVDGAATVSAYNGSFELKDGVKQAICNATATGLQNIAVKCLP